jgi:hypothetical protein
MAGERHMNENERYFFDLNGYLTVPSAISAEQIRTLNGMIDEHIATSPDPQLQSIGFGDVLSWRGEMLNLIDNPPVLPYLDALFGPMPWSNADRGPFFRLDHAYITVIRPGAKDAGAFVLHGGGTPYDPGQFYHFKDSRMFNGLVVVAYNITDVNPGDGGLGVVPGSHKANLRLPKDWQDLRKGSPVAKAVTGAAGTAVFFTEALSHGTLPWNGKHERRTVFLKYHAYCSAFSDNYLDEVSAEWDELTERQRRILEAPNCRSKDRKKEMALARKH